MSLKQDGKLPFVPGEEEMILGVSKYGVKVASLDQCVSLFMTLCVKQCHDKGKCALSVFIYINIRLNIYIQSTHTVLVFECISILMYFMLQ